MKEEQENVGGENKILRTLGHKIMFHVKLSKSISCDLIRETFKNKCRETFLKPLFSGMLLIIGSQSVL